MAVTVNAGPEYKPLFFTGLSTDAKPSTYSAPGNTKQKVPDRSEFLETDTGNQFILMNGSWIIIDHDFQQVVSLGQMFDTGYFWTSIANNANADIVLELTNDAHLWPIFSAGGEAKCNIYRNPTYTVGTALVLVNKDETSSKTTTAVAKRDPTVTAAGTEIHVEGIMGGSGGVAAGGSREIVMKHVLAGGNNYLFRINNLSGVANPAFIGLDFRDPLAA